MMSSLNVTHLVVEDSAGILHNVRDLGNGLPASFKLSRHTVAATNVCADLGGREGAREREREGGKEGRREEREERGREEGERRGGGRKEGRREEGRRGQGTRRERVMY